MILFPLLIFLHFRFRSSIASQDSLELPSGIAPPPPQVSQNNIYPKKYVCIQFVKKFRQFLKNKCQFLIFVMYFLKNIF